MRPSRFRPGGWICDRFQWRAAQVTRAEDLRRAVSPELAAEISEAIFAVERGETDDLGSFAQYAGDDGSSN